MVQAELEGSPYIENEEVDFITPLGISPDDAVVLRLQGIVDYFSKLKLPLSAFPKDQQDKMWQRLHEMEILPPSTEDGFPPDFQYGEHYFFGRNKGKPRSIAENAATAIYEERQGVEEWRILKSVALTTPDGRLVVVHVRGDRTVDKQAVANHIRIPIVEGIDPLPAATIEQLTHRGAEYGTVGPFMEADEHVFDRDLVDGRDYPNDDIVFASAGDPSIYVGFNIRRLLVAQSKLPASYSNVTIPVSTSEVPRVVARQDVHVIGGDSGVDANLFSNRVLKKITDELDGRNSYFGDRSLPNVVSLSDRRLAGSIDTSLYGTTLRAYISRKVRDIAQEYVDERQKPIVTVSSMAMHGIAGDILQQAEGVEYIGPEETVRHLIDALRERNIEVSQTVLIGLPSMYDKTRSAFKSMLDTVASLREDEKTKIRSLVQQAKVQQMDLMQLYQLIGNVTKRVTSRSDETVLVLLGASELEAEVDKFHKPPFPTVKSSNPDDIAQALGKMAKGKTRFIIMQPNKAVAERIARKTLGLDK